MARLRGHGEELQEGVNADYDSVEKSVRDKYVGS